MTFTFFIMTSYFQYWAPKSKKLFLTFLARCNGSGFDFYENLAKDYPFGYPKIKTDLKKLFSFLRYSHFKLYIDFCGFGTLWWRHQVTIATTTILIWFSYSSYEGLPSYQVSCLYYQPIISCGWRAPSPQKLKKAQSR